MFIACVISLSVFFVVLLSIPAYTLIWFHLFVLCCDALSPFLLFSAWCFSSIIKFCPPFCVASSFPLFPILISFCIGGLLLVLSSRISFTSSMSFAFLLNLLLIILLKDVSLSVLI